MIATQSRRAPPPRRRALAGAAALASAARPASSRAAHASRPGTWRRPLRTPRELAQPARGERAHAQESARGEERERERERARASPPAVSPSRRGKRRAHARWAQLAGFLSGGEKAKGWGRTRALPPKSAASALVVVPSESTTTALTIERSLTRPSARASEKLPTRTRRCARTGGQPGSTLSSLR